jgi:AraC-like DNA-binding protein
MHGVSVHRYYRRRQLDRAWRLLADDRVTIGCVAVRAGFTDQSHMTRAFVREVGDTPGAVRRRMLTGEKDARHWYRSAPVVAASASASH